MMSQLHLGAGVFKSVDLTGHSQSHIPREAEVTLHAVFSTNIYILAVTRVTHGFVCAN